MNTLSKLSLLACAFISVTACNEKVSPELKGASASSGTTTTSSGSTSIVAPDQYYFRVVNSADAMLNYKLHKTGTGNASSNCSISGGLQLSSDLYRANPSAYDITCYFEAEELVLNYNGLSFSPQASKNTCEYVGYMPYSYYNFQPGASTQSIHKLTCDDNATAALAQAADGTLTTTSCNAWRSVTAGADVIVEDEKEFCVYNYSTYPNMPPTAPNCDDGILSFTDYVARGVDADGDGIYESAKVTKTPRTVRCGGNAVNCIQGPIKLVSELVKYTSGIQVVQTVPNIDYTRQYDLPRLFGNWASNVQYVNYRRDLASLNIEYGNSGRNLMDGVSGNATTLATAYMSSFSDPVYKNIYNPELAANYANNLKMDGTTLVTPTMATDRKFDNFKGPNIMGIAHAAEPFIGLGTGYKTSPFYAFYCFDSAFDVKARIRMVVREWDRSLPQSATNAAFERISDVDQLPPMARQDVPYTVEISGDPDSWNDFNDLMDWDDMIDMEREDAGIPYDPSVTVWRPYPESVFVDGFMNPYSFPMEIQQNQ